jgi:DNA-binding Lrp family transcriptional regulator
MPTELKLPLAPSAAQMVPSDATVARIVTRLSAEYVLSAFQLLIDAHGDVRSGLLVQAINTANIGHLDARTERGRQPAGPGGVLPDGVRRPISIARLAESTGLPVESTRRIVQRLIVVGDCARVEGGVIVPKAVVERPATERMVMANVRYVRAFVRKLLAFGLVEEAAPRAQAWRPSIEDAALGRLVARLSGEYCLRALQLLVDTYRDIRTGIIAQTIVASNTAHLEAPMGEGWRYAGIDSPPPDETRRPVSVSAVARSLGLPFETVRRHSRRLIDAGVCVRVDGGLIVPMSVLEQPASVSAMLANVRNVRKFVRDLRAAGFDPNAP